MWATPIAVGGWANGELAGEVSAEDQQLIQYLAREIVDLYAKGKINGATIVSFLVIAQNSFAGPSTWSVIQGQFPDDTRQRIAYVLAKHYELNLKKPRIAKKFLKEATETQNQ